MKKLQAIRVWRDESFRCGATQMAIDETLFHQTIRSKAPHIRFYHWNEETKTVGYFYKAKGITPSAAPFTRRYTGGGIVEHGEDITFALCLPADNKFATIASADRYRWIHEKCRAALEESGEKVSLTQENSQKNSPSCFEAPVAWDLCSNSSGAKIGGGAQRRSKGAIIHQGSIRLPPALRSPSARWVTTLLSLLADKPERITITEKAQIEYEAENLRSTRYSLDSWNYRR